MAHITIDRSARTWLPICQDCGWRGDIETSQLGALVAGQRHEFRAHTGTHHTAKLLDTTTRRLTRS